MNKIFLLLITLFTYNAIAQDINDIEWTRIAVPAQDLSMAVPNGYLVHNEKSSHDLYAQANNVSIKLTVLRKVDAAQRMSAARKRFEESQYKSSRFKVGEYTVDSYVRTAEKYGISLYVASGKDLYFISARAKTAADPVLTMFLQSIKLGGRPLIKQGDAVTQTGAATPIDQIETSAIVKQALKRKDNGERKITYSKIVTDPVTYESTSDPVEYSRPLIVLDLVNTGLSIFRDKPSGRVLLSVTFLANGQVGDIEVLAGKGDSTLNSVLTNAAATKFLPAEIDGKPVDTVRMLEYYYRSL